MMMVFLMIYALREGISKFNNTNGIIEINYEKPDLFKKLTIAALQLLLMSNDHSN